MTSRIIGVVLIKDSVVVQTTNFHVTNIIHADPIFATRKMYNDEVDEIVVIDLNDQITNSSYSIIKKILSHVFVPVTLSAPFRSRHEIDLMFEAGVERLIFNSGFWQLSDYFSYVSDRYGMQAILPVLEYRSVSGFLHTIHRGSTVIHSDIHQCKKILESLHIPELLLIPIDHDGSFSSPELVHSTKFICNQYQTILFGGISTAKDMSSVLDEGHTSVAIGNAFHYSEGICTSFKYRSCLSARHAIRPPSIEE